MTDLIAYKADRWLYPIEPANDSADVLRVRAGTSGAWQTVSLTIQTYYAIGILSAASGVAGGQRLWLVLAAAIQTALGSGTVTIEAQDASSQLDLGFDRIQLRWSEGVWQLEAALNGFIHYAALGFAFGEHTSDASGVIRATYTYAGAWHSFNPYGGGALTKFKAPIADYAFSSKRHWEASAVSWGVQDVRLVRYGHIPSARLFVGHSNDAQRAATAALMPGDSNAQLAHLFRAMQDPQALIVLQHDVTAEIGVDADALVWERVQLWEPWLDFRQRVADMGMAGDYWSFEVAVRVVAGDYTL